MKRAPLALAVLALLPVASPRPAAAWFTVGHSLVARAAVAALPEEVPSFFRDGASTLGHLAVDPDLMKPRDLPALSEAESPEHYVDLELLGGRPLPAGRYAYHRLLRELAVDPSTAGLLPYAVTEGTHRLTMAFAEYRHSPYDPHIQAKALHYGGLLAHYAADLAQPLHTTIHHNGRALADGTSPRTGFHYAIDALVERAAFDRAAAAATVEVEAFPDVWAAVLAMLAGSHALVDASYELEPLLDRETGRGYDHPRVTAFTSERFSTAASFLASLWLTAWRASADIPVPVWTSPGLEREGDRSAPAATRGEE